MGMRYVPNETSRFLIRLLAAWVSFRAAILSFQNITMFAAKSFQSFQL